MVLAIIYWIMLLAAVGLLFVRTFVPRSRYIAVAAPKRSDAYDFTRQANKFLKGLL
jgi:hypothetical protein